MTWRKQLGANVAGKVEEKGFEAETSMKINGNVVVVSKGGRNDPINGRRTQK
jgi:hypothetical protein